MSGSTLTMDDVRHLQSARERAESTFAYTCRRLREEPDNDRLLRDVQEAARRFNDAQAQYAMALRAVGTDQAVSA